MVVQEPDKLYQQFLYEKWLLERYGTVGSISFEEWVEIKNNKKK